MNKIKKLRLGPLPKTESVKLTFSCPARLKTDLDPTPRSGICEALDAEKLIPYMLEEFMARDRGFRKISAGKNPPPAMGVPPR